MRKKISFFVCLVFIFFFSFNVNAENYKTNTLIPVDTLATVKTEKFSYNNFLYSSQVDAKGNALIAFDSIQNLTISKVPVSINILLFDESKRNIGFLTYCSDKDISSNYAGFKLVGNQSAPFSINVTDKYFVQGKLPVNVRYIAVLDDNKYCKIGGYDKYDGLTIDEIVNGFVGKNNKYAFTLSSIIMELVEKFGIDKNGKLILQWIIYIIIICVCLTIIGKILNILNRKIYAQKTLLAYLPIGNVFVASKLVFGSIIAYIYIIIYIVSLLLYFAIGPFLLIITNIIALIIFLLVIVKLVTRKYDLFYFEPTVKSNNYNSSTDDVNYDKNKILNKNISSDVVENKNGNNIVNNSNQVLVDLSYSDKYDSTAFDNGNTSVSTTNSTTTNNMVNNSISDSGSRKSSLFHSESDIDSYSSSSLFNSDGMIAFDNNNNNNSSGDSSTNIDSTLGGDSNSSNLDDFDDDFYDSLDDD